MTDDEEVMVDRLDDLQNASRFDEVDALIGGLVASAGSPGFVVSVLGITLAAKARLPARVKFFRDANSVVAASVLERYR